MNSLAKFVASISALIASLSFAWIALTITEMIPHRHLTVYHNGGIDLSSSGFELTSGLGGFDITHSGSVEIFR
jgi:hypothetical protein